MPFMEFEDLAKLLNLNPTIIADNSCAALQLMEGKDYKLIVITNTSCHQKEISTKIKCNFDIESATMCSSIDDDIELSVNENVIEAENIGDGCIIVIK